MKNAAFLVSMFIFSVSAYGTPPTDRDEGTPNKLILRSYIYETFMGPKVYSPNESIHSKVLVNLFSPAKIEERCSKTKGVHSDSVIMHELCRMDLGFWPLSKSVGLETARNAVKFHSKGDIASLAQVLVDVEKNPKASEYDKHLKSYIEEGLGQSSVLKIAEEEARHTLPTIVVTAQRVGVRSDIKPIAFSEKENFIIRPELLESMTIRTPPNLSNYAALSPRLESAEFKRLWKNLEKNLEAYSETAHMRNQ